MLFFAVKSFEQLFSPPFRTVLAKSLGLTLAMFVAVWLALQAVLSAFTIGPYPWIDTIVAILAGIGLIIGLVFIIGPVTALFAGLFLDEIAQTVEVTHYSDDPPGEDAPVLKSLIMAAKFAFIVILVNIGVLLLVFFPIVNIAAYLLGNGYLLGREYFEMVGMRHMPLEQARVLRRQNRATVLFAGGLIAALAVIPVLNLLTPLFATAFMVHVFKHLAQNAVINQIDG